MLKELETNEAPENGEETRTEPLTTEQQIEAWEDERAAGKYRSIEISRVVSALEIELDAARERRSHRMPGAAAEVSDLERKINERRAEDNQIGARDLELMREISAATAPAAWRASSARAFGLTPEQAALLEGDTPAKIHEHAQKFAQSLASAQPRATAHSFQKSSDVAW